MTTEIIAVWAEGAKHDPATGYTSDDLQVMGVSATNGMPWPHNPSDLKHFAATTADHVLIMGRKTYESLPLSMKYSVAGTAARPIVVLTRNPLWAMEQQAAATHNGVTALFGMMTDPAAVLAYVRSHFPDKSVAVIGGPAVIELFAPFYDHLVQTFHSNPAGWVGDVLAPFVGHELSERFICVDANRLTQYSADGKYLTVYKFIPRRNPQAA